MNCTECTDNLVGLAEDLLSPAEKQACLAHLDGCANCRAEYAATARLHSRLVARGQAANVHLVAAVMQQIQQTPPPRESIMSKIIRHRWSFGLSAAAVAAAFTIIATVAVPPKAFGVDQVIAAYNKVRSLHIKQMNPADARPNEYWIKCNDRGQVQEGRYNLYGTEDGDKFITWTPEKTEIWFKSKNGFLVMQSKQLGDSLQYLIDTSQPQLVLKKVAAAQKAGKVDVQTREPGGGQTNATITVTTIREHVKVVYYVDRSTDLITRMERFTMEGGKDVLKTTFEFSDYNVPVDEKVFSLRNELPPDVHVADQLHQTIGVPQGGLTDAQAAADTVRQFFQAVLDKNYKKAGLISSGVSDEFVKTSLGESTVIRIVTVGPAELQTKMGKRVYRVPCTLEVVQPSGKTVFCYPSPYVRPGDDEAHPNNWNISGGLGLPTQKDGTSAQVLPENAKDAAMTPEQTARAFFEACSQKDWDKAGKLMPYLDDQMKERLGGLKVISIGESISPEQHPGPQAHDLPGRFVPYEIQLSAEEIDVRVSDRNAAKRLVLTGIYDSHLKLEQDLKWSGDPVALAADDPDIKLSAAEAVKAYFDAQSKLDWTEMGKFTSAWDVKETQSQTAQAQKDGVDIRQVMPSFEVGEATWSAADSAWFVRCTVRQTKKWNLALRKDNEANRWVVDGGL